MSETTQGSSPASALSSAESKKSGVDLAPFFIAPSIMLWRLELAIYSGFLCAASVALFPFFLSAYYWPIVWLVFCGFIAFELRKAWRATHAARIELSIQKNVWRLKTADRECVVEPFDEILLWPAVIILPLGEIDSRKKHRIVILQDSVKKDDWRRLRVWLKTAFKNHTN
ncbi:protein YgfX [Cellvibrio sp.]|uniref:protein YgfX n=1 Tax=Cellvibrio sp. TaxID=1965322 RepID=UPI0039648608